MSTKPSISLSFVFARNSTKTVIFRRGPSSLFRCILWDRADDCFEDGQWFKGTIYPEKSSLSPDGKYMIYFALDGRWHREAKGCWTAISRPPYLTALSLFPEGDTWGGGGVFLDNLRYVVNTSSSSGDILRRPTGLERVFRTKVPRDEVPEFVDANGRPVSVSEKLKERIHARDRFDAPLQGYHCEDGKLYQRILNEDGTFKDHRLIRDFTDMSFEAIRAPYDDGPLPSGPTSWHPLDREDAP